VILAENEKKHLLVLKPTTTKGTFLIAPNNTTIKSIPKYTNCKQYFRRLYKLK